MFISIYKILKQCIKFLSNNHATLAMKIKIKSKQNIMP